MHGLARDCNNKDMRIAELEAAMDEASDTAGTLFQMVGRLQPRLGGDGRKCVEIMDMLVTLSEQLETASNRKARHDLQE
jgi:ABC-type transporter Mla subunit MlaD